MTVRDLIALLRRYPEERTVVYIDPDTTNRMPLVIRDPESHELEEGEAAAPPLVLTSDYSLDD